MTHQSPAHMLASSLMHLQNTYVDLLKEDETEAYEEVGLTLRCYAESLSLMTFPEIEEDDLELDDDD